MMKKILMLLVIFAGLLTACVHASYAFFSDERDVPGARLSTAIWNPGVPTITEFMYDPVGSDIGKEYVEITNTGGYALNLSGYVLHFDGVGNKHYVFPSAILNPEAKISVHLRSQGDNTSSDLYWTDTGSVNMANNAGSIALFNGLPKNAAHIVDFVEYGAGGKAQENNAVSAGIWNAGDFIPDAIEGSRIILESYDTNKSEDWIAIN